MKAESARELVRENNREDMFHENNMKDHTNKCTKFASGHLWNYLMRRNRNSSSHAAEQSCCWTKVPNMR
ncbi:hypothetical protein K7X08_036367 [Anisodus acutangulus]|uniref:Uncharacterized protein n=1 Tax=Anisodus acutangulus TaxID=402998 RepID=A0A9Q1L5W0_9SOLA|nr:hypothetical protein K7X08_036367 [Anisodus acutangulus]